VISNAIDGKATSATDAATAGLLGTAGAGAGAKIANKMAQKLDKMSNAGGVLQHVAETTRSAYIGTGSGAPSSVGAEAGKIASDIIANVTQKEVDN